MCRFHQNSATLYCYVCCRSKPHLTICKFYLRVTVWNKWFRIIITQNKMGKKCDCGKPRCGGKCKRSVDVGLQMTPNVEVREKCQRDGQVNVELDITANPVCKMKQKGCERTGDCGLKLTFEVDINPNFKCTPCVTSGPNPSAQFDMDFGVQGRARLRNTCEGGCSKH